MHVDGVPLTERRIRQWLAEVLRLMGLSSRGFTFHGLRQISRQLQQMATPQMAHGIRTKNYQICRNCCFQHLALTVDSAKRTTGQNAADKSNKEM